MTDSSKRPTFDIADYVTRQLAKTKNKRFEAYVISRIIHLLNDLSLKFVTQQYVRRSDERIALTDLYFPQLGIHIEVDEGHHFISLQHSNHPRLSHVLQKETDAIREQDIINVTGHQILRVNVFRDEYHQPISLTSIHQQVDVILNTIRLKKKQLIDENKFTLWEPEKEFNPQTYIERGYISLADDVIFKTQADACNCFGHTYKSLQRGGANHAIESDTLIWFPRLYQNDRWINSISADGLIITEKSVDDEITHQHIDHWRTGRQKRIVFARVKDNLSSRAMYRFLGVFKLKLAEPEVGAVWERIADRVKTYAATQI
ncbi:restriction endonuclease [Acinetobacter sp. NCu2D-2]|uniref:AbaSI family restriction endonuclease n=1 Tax=Acinetobacter sp. NCu2D-2 TaxID=1608473 RepID=UPI0007CE0B32|nr:restriction endonuclease [Acinetobacter sp. NCu2D-2]